MLERQIELKQHCLKLTLSRSLPSVLPLIVAVLTELPGLVGTLLDRIMDYAIFLGGFIADFVRQSVQASDILDDEEACAELHRVENGEDIVAEVVDPVVEDGIEIIMSTVSP